jgi:hypothetical protein
MNIKSHACTRAQESPPLPPSLSWLPPVCLRELNLRANGIVTVSLLHLLSFSATQPFMDTLVTLHRTHNTLVTQVADVQGILALCPMLRSINLGMSSCCTHEAVVDQLTFP